MSTGSDNPPTLIILSLMRANGATGVQSHVRALGRYLDGRGQPWRLVTPFDAPKWLLYPMLAIRRLIDRLSPAAAIWWYRRGHAWLLRLALGPVLKRAPLDAGVACYAQCPVSADVALRCRSSPRQAVTMVVHFNRSQADEWVGKGRLAADHRLVAAIRSFEDNLLARVDALVFVSAWMQRQLVGRLDLLRGTPRAVIPNFITDPDRSAMPMALPLRDLIAIGTLEPRKNFGYLLDILAAARWLGRSLSVTIVGDGPDRAALQAKAGRAGLAGQVHFAGGVADAARLIPAHRALIHVASVETFGMVLIEAMAHGRPVFAPDAGGMAEVFDDGIEGRRLPLGDAARAAAILCASLDDAGTLAAMAMAARQRFLRDFSERAVADRLLTFIRCTDASSSPSSSHAVDVAAAYRHAA